MTSSQIIDVNGRPIMSPKRKAAAVRSRYLRGDGVGTVQMRQASLRDHRDDIRSAWPRAAALAIDVLQNNGRLSGAVDQILADTVGTELIITPNPDFSGMPGWTKKRREDWIALVKRRWNHWSSNPLECDLRGKQTIGQMTDAVVRWSIGYGEGTGIVSYLTPQERQQRGAETGTKICMVPPHKLVQDTNEFEGLFQGVIHDADNMPIGYRLREKINGFNKTRDYAARDAIGRKLFIHVMDGEPGDVRGIGKFAPSLKTWLQFDQLTDMTMAQQYVQTLFAASHTSSNLDGEALEGLLALNDVALSKDLVENMVGYNNAKLEAAQTSSIDFGTHGRINSLPAGDKFEFHTPGTTTDTYIPLANNLLREISRGLGITTASLTMDYSGSTYSSVRMETASIWPVVIRRRKRIAAPVPKTAYENWLDEEIGEGRIPFYGGYEAFIANRNRVSATTAQGPQKPTADDLKAAKASSERLYNGTSNLDIECAEIGIDGDENIDRRAIELKNILSKGLPNPFERNPGAGADLEDSTKEIVNV